jgi:hypothetical protein
MKTVLMVLAMAGVFAGGTACFIAPPRSAPPADTGIEACAGLDGEAKRECEARHAP